MKIEINYASGEYKKIQQNHANSAYKKGRFDKVICYSPDDLDDDFKQSTKEALEQSKGGGYWIWKPYILKKTLAWADEGDYVFYCDAAAYYVRPIDKLIKSMNRDCVSIMCFELPFLEKQWTKQDVFDYFQCNDKEYTNTNQRLATFILMKNDAMSRRFVDEWYETAVTAPFLFTDSSNRLGGENTPEFVEHRHDQSIFSILSKKYQILPYRDISQYGKHPGLYKYNANIVMLPSSYVCSDYPTLIALHRCKQMNWKIRLRMWTGRTLPTELHEWIWNGIGMYVRLKKHIKG